MHLDAAHLVMVAGAALLAGAVNAVAGGGTLLSFPALLLLHPERAKPIVMFRYRTMQPARERAIHPFGRLGGLKGGKARAEALSPRKRSQIAAKAAKARWGKK